MFPVSTNKRLTISPHDTNVAQSENFLVALLSGPRKRNMGKNITFSALYQTWKFPEMKHGPCSQIKAFINSSKKDSQILIKGI